MKINDFQKRTRHIKTTQKKQNQRKGKGKSYEIIMVTDHEILA